jgi:hypothetical protein
MSDSSLIMTSYELVPGQAYFTSWPCKNYSLGRCLYTGSGLFNCFVTIYEGPYSTGFKLVFPIRLKVDVNGLGDMISSLLPYLYALKYVSVN